jgi:transcription elongation factor GreA
MSKKTLLTAEGLAEIQKELSVLKEERRIEIAEKLKEAISFGDLSENSEYEDARNEQAQVELRIIELEEILKNYELVDAKKAAKKNNVVAIGSTVVVKNEEGETETYKIVGPTETDIFEGKISNESPIGAALIGKAVGETASGKSHSGAFAFKVVELK